MKTRVNEEIKKRIFQNVTDFITLWNSDEANIDKIHDAALLESQEKKILSIGIKKSLLLKEKIQTNIVRTIQLNSSFLFNNRFN